MKFRKTASSIIILQLFLTNFISLFNPVFSSDDYISEEPPWTKFWEGNIGSVNNMASVNSIATDQFNKIYILRDIFDSKNLSYDYFLTKLNNSGSLEWEVPLNYNGIAWDGYQKIKIDAYNDIYLLGTFTILGIPYLNITLLKYDPIGNQIWNKTLKDSEGQKSYDMDSDSLGNLYLVGFKENSRLVKLNNSGSILWNHTWGENKSYEYTAITIDSNDYIYVTGFNNYNSILIKFNSTGYCEWNYTWKAYYKHDLTLDFNGNILVASGNKLLKLNPNGFSLWNFTLPSNSVNTPGLSIDSLNNIYIAENREIPCYDNTLFGGCGWASAIYLEKVNSSGDFMWEKRCTGCVFASCSDIAIDSVGNIYLSGYVLFELGSMKPLSDAILMKNPKTFEGLCIPIYYNLIILITVLLALNVLIVVSVFLIRYKRKKKKV
ncbi:MAG: hypothetical protein ACFFB4_04830 [Promethearchaeota archaeon]